MGNTWQGLLQNLAIVVLVVTVLTHGLYWTDARPLAVRRAFGAAVSGGGVLLLMSFPVELEPGLFTDLRATVIGLTGFLGGPIAGVVVGLIAAAYRFYLGGVGTQGGLFGIALAAAVGAGGNFLLRGRLPRARELLVLAAAIVAVGPLGYIFLPWDMVLPTLARVALPSATMNFVATVVAGLAVIQDIRQRTDARQNLIYRSIIDLLPDPLNAKDLDGHFVVANPATARLMHAASPEALIGKTDADFYPSKIAEEYQADDRAVIAGGEPVTVEQRFELALGASGWLSSIKVPLRNEAGKIVGVLTHNRDVTETRRLEREIAENRRLLDDALTYMADGLVMLDRDAHILLCNDQYRALFPLTADIRVPGSYLGDILRASVERGEQADIPMDKIDQWIRRAVATFARPGERAIHLSDGRWLTARVRPSGDGGSLTVISDITRMKQAEAALSELNHRLAKLATTDGLTGLVNRRGYDAELAREFMRAKRSSGPLSLLLIDVDKFKAYNDTYGHPAGDECLRAIARCLQGVLKRPTDIAARYGGEEFAAILPDTPLAGARQLAEELLEAVRAMEMPHVGSQTRRVTVSAGAASCFGDLPAVSKEALARAADAALYAAKASGRDRVCDAGDAPRLSAASNG